MFINSKGVDKRMVVDRQKGPNQIRVRRYRVADRLVVKASKIVRQAGTTKCGISQRGMNTV
jgi:hypothetical protein